MPAQVGNDPTCLAPYIIRFLTDLILRHCSICMRTAWCNHQEVQGLINCLQLSPSSVQESHLVSHDGR